MVMLLRHTALRISDVATLRKDSVSWETRYRHRGTPRSIPRTTSGTALPPQAGGGGDRGADARGGVQEIGRQERARPPIPAYSGHEASGAGRHVRAGSRH